MESEFFFKQETLYCEGLKVADLARKHGTPLYVYSAAAYRNRYQEVAKAFASASPLICFSVKSCSNLSILKLLGRMGAGADIVSGGELFRCLKAGISASRIVYAGVGKTDDEIRYALKSGIRLFNVESLPELHAINRIAGSLKTRARIGFRINPDVDAKTHAKTTTGKKENKFGIPIVYAADYFREAASLKHIIPAAVDVHLGSPIFSVEPYVKAMNKLLPLILDLKAAGLPIEELDIGGGFGVKYENEKPFTVKALAQALLPGIRKSGLKLICEPGRYLTGNSGVLCAKVVYVKKTDVKNFIIVDTGMNDLIRPALYDSHHRIVLAEKRSGAAKITADVVGPICESSDFLGKARLLPEPVVGDIIAVLTAGAYGFSMSSNYNARPRACEVLVEGKRAKVIRRRETWDDLIRGE